jgi:hypothetical protein
MKNLKKIASFLFCLFLISCFSNFEKNEIIGIYVPMNYKNNFDTICLLPNFTYKRSIYNKKNKLIFTNKGNWFIEKGKVIDFDNFIVNFDEDYLRYPETLKDTSNNWKVTIEIKHENIEFCIGYYQGEYCYRKIK